jgi:hypothetical protein
MISYMIFMIGQATKRVFLLAEQRNRLQQRLRDLKEGVLHLESEESGHTWAKEAQDEG